jgi:hypothetical protein
MQLASSIPLASGFIDGVELLAGRLLRVTGRSADDPRSLITLMVNGKRVEMSISFRTYRPDVSEATGNANRFLGFVEEYLLEPALNAGIDLSHAGRTVYSTTAPITAWPDSPELIGTERVLGRDEIYYARPPADIVTPEILALALELPDPILDFGCGGCGPLRALLNAGRDVRGH